MKKLLLFTAVAMALCACGNKDYDLCIYGGNASGIVAADAAAKMGLNVVMVEPTCRIGGMVTGGLGRTDIGNKQAVRGLSIKFFREVGKRYGNLESWTFEPSVAHEVLSEFCDSPRIKIVKGYHLADALTEGGKIKTIKVAGGENSADTLSFSAKWFIDASYEGDLMAKAGVEYRTGREDNSEFNETWNGSQLLHEHHQFPYGVDPFVEPGNPESGLLWGISDQKVIPNGCGDDLIQAYNFRICLTDQPENMIPIEKPDNYDPSKYELLIRLFEAQPDLRSINDYFIWTLMPNHKTDINNRGAFSTDMIGMNYSYPEASWEERQEIIKAHKDYTLGLLYFYTHDDRVPAELRDEVAKWGLCKDEYTECGNWTPQLYVRECRRMVGEYVASQADCENKADVTDGVAFAAYQMDSHNCQRIVTLNKDGKFMVENEGDVEKKVGIPYPISYRAITPKRAQCTNLVVPVCCSATHIAYGSIRMEPVFMNLGQVAGIAVALAEKNKLADIQDVDYRQINEIIENDPYMDGTVPDVLIDDVIATSEGEGWKQMKRAGGYGPSYYQGPANTGCVKFTGKPAVAGTYKIYSTQHTLAEGMNTVTVFDFSNGQSVTVNAADVNIIGATKAAWHEIGEVKLDKDEEFTVSVHGDGGEGFVRADAILLVKK